MRMQLQPGAGEERLQWESVCAFELRLNARSWLNVFLAEVLLCVLCANALLSFQRRYWLRSHGD